MKFFNSKFAPNARRVRIFMAEKTFVVPWVDVDLGNMEHKTEAFSAINPFLRVPCLALDDGDILCESIAICRYIEALRPEPALFGRNPKQMAFIEMWQRQIEFYLFQPVALAFRHSHPAMKLLENPQIAELAAVSKPRALEAMAVIDRVLKDKRYIAGDEYSVADITGLVAMDFTKQARIETPVEFANIIRWHKELLARPSATA